MKKKTKKYLTIDIGGTFIKYSLMDEQFEVFDEGSVATKKDPEEFLAQLLAVADGYYGRIDGIAICMGGFIDPQTGENTDYSVGENFRAYNLKKVMEERFHLPVALENDSNCAALGELAAGAGKEYNNFCLLTIGTGVGGAIVWDKKLIRGSHFKAGEAGFCQVGLDKEAPNGYTHATATADLTARVGKAVGEKVDGYYIFGHLEEEKILEIYEEWLERLAVTVGNAAVLLDPEAVLIGGGVCRQERFIEDLRSRVYRIFPHLEEYTQIKACVTGNLAGRIGALSLLLAGG